jgi:hypothetical protein
MSKPLPLPPLFRSHILPPLRAAGFWEDRGFSGTHAGVTWAGCIKPFADRLALYVHLIDTRADGGQLRCRVWFSPWHDNDDSLENFAIGHCFIVYGHYEINKTIAKGIAQRVLAIDRLVPALRESVLAEMRKPAIPTYRWSVWREEQRLIAALSDGASPTLTKAWEALKDEIASWPRSKLTYQAMSRRAQRFRKENQEALNRLKRAQGIDCLLGEYVEPLGWELWYAEMVRRDAAPAVRPSPKKR